MSTFSHSERFIARFLSRFPVLKRSIKKAYNYLCSFIFSPSYTYKLLDGYSLKKMNSQGESFFGYYDKSPENETAEYCIYQRSDFSTNKKPEQCKSLYIVVYDLINDEVLDNIKTHAFNWQQGCKLQWISNYCFIFNDYKNGKYVSFVYDVQKKQIVKEYKTAIYDVFKSKFSLTLSFERLAIYSKDYGYFSHSNASLLNESNDGVYILNMLDGNVELLLSIENISKFEFSNLDSFTHTVNHIMISPDGEHFIFIHRWYDSNKRYDRLIFSDLTGNMKVLSNDKMVSHCCWKSNTEIIGYFRHDGEDGYYTIDVSEITPFLKEKIGKYGDGHPTYKNNRFITDTYPNRACLQYLISWDTEHDFNIIGEFYHPVRFSNETRCDLHPRISFSGERIYFDSVFNGTRQVYYVEKNE